MNFIYINLPFFLEYLLYFPVFSIYLFGGNMNKVSLLLFIVLAYAWPPTVRISDGYSIKGKHKGHSAIFYGIPYAAPPVGDLRWRAPQLYIRPNNTLLKAYNRRMKYHNSSYYYPYLILYLAPACP